MDLELKGSEGISFITISMNNVDGGDQKSI